MNFTAIADALMFVNVGGKDCSMQLVRGTGSSAAVQSPGNSTLQPQPVVFKPSTPGSPIPNNWKEEHDDERVQIRLQSEQDVFDLNPIADANLVAVKFWKDE